MFRSRLVILLPSPSHHQSIRAGHNTTHLPFALSLSLSYTLSPHHRVRSSSFSLFLTPNGFQNLIPLSSFLWCGAEVNGEKVEIRVHHNTCHNILPFNVYFILKIKYFRLLFTPLCLIRTHPCTKPNSQVSLLTQNVDCWLLLFAPLSLIL